MRLIKIVNAGDTGNRMFQYMFCRMLQARVPKSLVYGYEMPMWELVSSHEARLPPETMRVKGGHEMDVGAIVEFLRQGENRGLEFAGYAQRVEYYGQPEFMASLFHVPSQYRRLTSSEYLLIHVRAGDILSGLSNADYVPVPITFYESIIARSRLRPVFMGQLEPSWYTAALQKRFPTATFLPQSSALEDFALLNSAVNVAISVSTYSWLAAWLSPIAKNIHVPVLGLLNRRQRPDINLLPVADERYSFYEFPVRRWHGSSEDLEFALDGPPGELLGGDRLP
jgi:hypothetical protein